MRYRVKDYTVDVYQGNARVFLTVPSTLIEAYPSFTPEEGRKVTEAIRLIIDETAGVVFCSSMQKDNTIQMQAQNNQDGTTEIAIYFAIPTGKTITSNDQFTIEMDWGDEPTGLSGGDDAHNLAQFFGLPEALPEGYQAMTEQEVTDTLEDIIGNLDIDLNQTVEYPEGSGNYMTRAQAITAQANEIIHPNS